MDRPFFRWLFYGHVWIALAAAALGWQSTYLAQGGSAVRRTHLFIFFATLAVYTAHRSISYRRAFGEPTGRRYGLVADSPTASVWVGVTAILVAAFLGLGMSYFAWLPLLLSLPFTFFYLIPIFPGGPRLRDLPYLKVIWVALAWMLVTDLLPKFAEGPPLDFVGAVVRFTFTLAVALLFDLRDVELDRRQGVRTFAARSPRGSRRLATLLLLACTVAGFAVYPLAQALPLGLAYGAGIVIAQLTHSDRSEDWYAAYVNGMLLLPPLFLFLLG
jgi:4-hydroxybenzoate polyprenyltransferase